jgi:hypothetical protein
MAIESLSLTEGDKLVITGSDETGATGKTNLIKIDDI